MRPAKKLPPWSRHHASWCAIFRGKSCDCDNLPPGDRKRVSRGGPGGVEPLKKEKELEEA